MNKLQFWLIEESYPGLQARYDVGVVPAYTADDAEALADEIGLSTGGKGVVFHASLATIPQIEAFKAKAEALIKQAKAFTVLIPYFDTFYT